MVGAPVIERPLALCECMDSTRGVGEHGQPGPVYDGGAPVRMAFLGPPGTYGNQAAEAFARVFPSPPELVACPDIPSIYTAQAEYLVMPFQNTIHGVVTETLDAILGSVPPVSNNGTLRDDYRGPEIIGDLDLPIRHCLVVKKGVRMDQIRYIRSHEQALGQSSKFLSAHLPLAKTVPWPSTAGAALSLLENTPEEQAQGEGSAICSKSVAALRPDELEVLYEGTQGIDCESAGTLNDRQLTTDNFTRFLLIRRPGTPSIVDDLDWVEEKYQSGYPSTFLLLDSLEDLTQTCKDTTIRAVHSRPRTYASTGSPPTDDNDHFDRIALTYPLRHLVELAGTDHLLGTTWIHVKAS